MKILVILFCIFLENVAFPFSISRADKINTVFAGDTVDVVINIEPDKTTSDSISLECLTYYNNLVYDRKILNLKSNENKKISAVYSFFTPNIDNNITMKLFFKIVNNKNLSPLESEIQIIPAPQNSLLNIIFKNHFTGVIDKNNKIQKYFEKNKISFYNIENLTELKSFNGEIILIGEDCLSSEYFEEIFLENKNDMDFFIFYQADIADVIPSSSKIKIRNNKIPCSNFFDYSDTNIIGEIIVNYAKSNIENLNNGLNVSSSTDLKPLLKIDNGNDSSTNIIFEIKKNILWCQLKKLSEFQQNADNFILFQTLIKYLIRKNKIDKTLLNCERVAINTEQTKFEVFKTELNRNVNSKFFNKIYTITNEENNSEKILNYCYDIISQENSSTLNLIFFLSSEEFSDNIYNYLTEKYSKFIDSKFDSSNFVNNIFKYISETEKKLLFSDRNNQIKKTKFLRIFNPYIKEKKNILFLPIYKNKNIIFSEDDFLIRELQNLIFNNILNLKIDAEDKEKF